MEMINLLPDEDKKEIRAGRANNILVRYVIATLCVLVLIGIELAGAYYYISYSSQQANEAIAENEAKSKDLLEKQNKVATFRKNLATTKQILDKQVDYTELILRVASVIPSGVVLDKLDLDSTTFDTPTTVDLRAKDESSLSALKQSLNDSSYFSNVHFNTISISTNSDTKYPYQVNLSLTYTRELTNE